MVLLYNINNNNNTCIKLYGKLYMYMDMYMDV